MRRAKILYFVNGNQPTKDDFANGNAINGDVKFRNATAYSDEGALEDCDGVAGNPPGRYADLPTADEAIQRIQDEFEVLASLTGDSRPPEPPAVPPKDGKTAKDSGKTSKPAWGATGTTKGG